MTDRAISELSRYMPSEMLINEGFLTLKDVSTFVRKTLKTTVKLLDDSRASIDGGYFDEFRDEALAHFYGNGERRPGL